MNLKTHLVKLHSIHGRFKEDRLEEKLTCLPKLFRATKKQLACSGILSKLRINLNLKLRVMKTLLNTLHRKSKYHFILIFIYSVVARLYVLKGKSLTPKDTNTSDPYLVIKLG